MGEKDFQQYFLIKKILGKKYKVNIIGNPIIRDKNKVALSTRNKLLNKKSIYITSCIAKRLINIKKNFKIKKLKMPNNLLKIKSDFEKKYIPGSFLALEQMISQFEFYTGKNPPRALLEKELNSITSKD